MNSHSYFVCTLVLFLLCNLSANFLVAQNDKWKEGTLITKSNEQFSGCIKRSKFYAREQVEIRQNCEKKKNLFFSKDVDRFTWGDERYKSVFVPAKIAPYEAVLIVKDKGFHYFLRVIAEGKYNLYEFEPGGKGRLPKQLILENPDRGSMWITPSKLNNISRRELKRLKSFFSGDAELTELLNSEDVSYKGFVEMLREVNK